MYFQIWQSTSNRNWYWHLKAANHEIIATGEGYQRKDDCLKVIGLVMATSQFTPIHPA